MRLRGFLLFALAVGACTADTFTSDDGGADAQSDVTVGSDSGSSDAHPTEAASPRFCETVDAQFCEDFDIPGDAGAGLTYVRASGGWLYTFESAERVSPPDGLQVKIGDAGGMAMVGAVLGAPGDAGAAKHAVLDFDVKLPTTSYAGNYAVFFFRFGNGGDSSGKGIFSLVRGGPWQFMNADVGTTVGTVPTGNWTHVRVTVNFGVVGSAVLDIGNGSAGAVLSGIDTTGGAGPPYAVSAVVGASGNPPVLGELVYFDNVVVHYQ